MKQLIVVASVAVLAFIAFSWLSSALLMSNAVFAFFIGTFSALVVEDEQEKA